MYIKKFEECDEIVVADGCLLRELLHPEKADLKLRYSLAHAIVKPGQVTKPHKLKTTEVYYILEGEGMMHINGEIAPVKAGVAVYIPPEGRQFIENTGNRDLKFLCIVDPAWKAEDEEVL